jgi:hypothetical protein
LSLEETKRLLATLQHQLVAAQIERHGQLCLTCPQCGRPFRGRGSYPVTFHSLFGDVPVRVRRLKSCPCPGRLPPELLDGLQQQKPHRPGARAS